VGQIEKIIWTIDAAASFEEVVQYIARDSPYYASEFAKRIIESIEKLQSFPQMGRIVPEYNDPDIRELIYHNYRIVYRVRSSSVCLLLITHGARQLPTIM
jgi:plasmid stabilization system protein ParE